MLTTRYLIVAVAGVVLTAGVVYLLAHGLQGVAWLAVAVIVGVPLGVWMRENT